ncbi:MAG: HD domain-containing protein [Chloroflexaceae bacterium]
MSNAQSQPETNRLESILRDLADLCAAQGVRAWLTGGAARDLVLRRLPSDLDVSVTGNGFELARAFADAHDGAFVALDAERNTGRAVLAGPPPLTVDISGLRGPGIEADLRLRDFTINALAVPLDTTLRLAPPPAALIDPTGGLADLRAGVVRPCGPTSLYDDPLRVVRAARLCATLDMRPAPSLADMARAVVGGLDQVAGERVRDELLKLLDAPAAAPWLRFLDACGALTRLIPELEPCRVCEQPYVHFLPVLAHMLETVAALDWLLGGPTRAEALPVAVQAHPELSRSLPFAAPVQELMAERRAGGHRRQALLKLAALLHDNAKPQTKVTHPDGKVSFYGHQELGADAAVQIGRRLRLSRNDVRYVELVVREHMRPGQLRAVNVLTPRARYRFFRDLGDAGPDVLLHELADHLATRGPHVDPQGWVAHLAWAGALLAHYYAPTPDRRVRLLDGNALMVALGIGPGPRVGALLREIAEAQAAGEIATREEAIELARQRMAADDTW